MYWDTLTAAGLLVSVISTAGAFYLALRERFVDRRNHLREI
jgi:hypothetical protein